MWITYILHSISQSHAVPVTAWCPPVGLESVVVVVVVVSEVEVEEVMVLRQCCSAAGLSLTNNGEETCTAV